MFELEIGCFAVDLFEGADELNSVLACCSPNTPTKIS